MQQAGEQMCGWVPVLNTVLCDAQAAASFDAARAAAVRASSSASNGNGAHVLPLSEFAANSSDAQAAALRSRIRTAAVVEEARNGHSARPAASLAQSERAGKDVTGAAVASGESLEAWMGDMVIELADTRDKQVSKQAARVGDGTSAPPGPSLAGPRPSLKLNSANGAMKPPKSASNAAVRPSTFPPQEAVAMAESWGGIDEDFEEAIRFLGPLRYVKHHDP